MKTNQLRTPIEKVFFRASKIGLLVNGVISHGLTERQRETMERLEKMKVTPEGITEKQQSDFKKWDALLFDGYEITDKQMAKYSEYKRKMKTPKPLTENQEKELQDLKEKNARPPELSQGAKTFVKELWLENEKGFREEITDKKLRKGVQCEEDAINLISLNDGVFYIKNEDRKYYNHTTGECDVKTDIPIKYSDSTRAKICKLRSTI